MGALRSWLAVGAAVLLASVAAFAAAGAQAQTAAPPTLTSEVLSSCGGTVPVGALCFMDVGTRAMRVRCNDDGTGTISWTATGRAAGPYTGTFTETGTASFAGPDPATGRAGPLTNLQVSFHIDSAVPDADVDGRKFLAVPSPTFGTCSESAEGVFGTVGGAGRYEAIIKPSMGGSFADEGATDLSVFTFAGGDDVATSTGYVTEFFTSTLPTTRPLLPDAKEQCKDQGFLIFGVFENQGDCVSFVSTHGNNEPGRNNG